MWADDGTPEQAAIDLGLPARNYTVDMGEVLLVGWFPGDSYNDANGAQASASALAWLDATLAAATKPCWIMCHFPLHDTVGGDVVAQWVSTAWGFYASSKVNSADSADILAILDSRPNAELWLSGHTHSNINTPGLFGLHNTGTREIACVNASAIASVDKAQSPWSEIRSAYVTREEAGLEVRWRDNGGGNWIGPADQPRVSLLTPTH